MFGKFKKFFFKENIEKKFNPEEFQSGQLVEMEYVDPKTIGIISPNSLTFTRLNHDEIENRVIRGTIERITKNKVLNCYVIAVKCLKKIEHDTIVRQYLFLDYEIKRCRVLT